MYEKNSILKKILRVSRRAGRELHIICGFIVTLTNPARLTTDKGKYF